VMINRARALLETGSRPRGSENFPKGTGQCAQGQGPNHSAYAHTRASSFRSGGSGY